MLVTDDPSGPMPDLKLEWSMPAFVLVGTIAAGLQPFEPRVKVVELAVELKGDLTVPALCDVDGQTWAVYVETQPWNGAAVNRLMRWLKLLQTSPRFASVAVRVYAPQRMPATVLARANGEVSAGGGFFNKILAFFGAAG